MASDQQTEWAGRWALVVAPERRPRVAREDLETSYLLLSVVSEEKWLRRMRGPESRQGESGIAHACVGSFRMAYCCGIQTWKLRTGTKLTTRGTKAQEAQKRQIERSHLSFLVLWLLCLLCLL